MKFNITPINKKKSYSITISEIFDGDQDLVKKQRKAIKDILIGDTIAEIVGKRCTIENTREAFGTIPTGANSSLEIIFTPTTKTSLDEVNDWFAGIKAAIEIEVESSVSSVESAEATEPKLPPPLPASVMARRGEREERERLLSEAVAPDSVVSGERAAQLALRGALARERRSTLQGEQLQDPNIPKEATAPTEAPTEESITLSPAAAAMLTAQGRSAQRRRGSVASEDDDFALGIPGSMLAVSKPLAEKLDALGHELIKPENWPKVLEFLQSAQENQERYAPQITTILNSIPTLPEIQATIQDKAAVAKTALTTAATIASRDTVDNFLALLVAIRAHVEEKKVVEFMGPWRPEDVDELFLLFTKIKMKDCSLFGAKYPGVKKYWKGYLAVSEVQDQYINLRLLAAVFVLYSYVSAFPAITSSQGPIGLLFNVALYAIVSALVAGVFANAKLYNNAPRIKEGVLDMFEREDKREYQTKMVSGAVYLEAGFRRWAKYFGLPVETLEDPVYQLLKAKRQTSEAQGESPPTSPRRASSGSRGSVAEEPSAAVPRKNSVSSAAGSIASGALPALTGAFKKIGFPFSSKRRPSSDTTKW